MEKMRSAIAIEKEKERERGWRDLSKRQEQRRPLMTQSVKFEREREREREREIAESFEKPEKGARSFFPFFVSTQINSILLEFFFFSFRYLYPLYDPNVGDLHEICGGRGGRLEEAQWREPERGTMERNLVRARAVCLLTRSPRWAGWSGRCWGRR